MPNTLAHIGASAIVSRMTDRRADLKWVFAGCIVPDIPWILQRAVLTLMPAVDPLDLRLYATAQSSLVMCLVLSGAMAAISAAPRRVFGILSLNSLVHLLLDAAQTKFGNGVHLFAPLSWELLNFGWFWPESPLTYLLTTLGLAVFAWSWRHRPGASIGFSLRGAVRAATALGLSLTYFVLPIFLLAGPEAADNGSVGTLRQEEARAGRRVEFDRVWLALDDSGAWLRTLGGERLEVVGLTPREPAMISARARFVNAKTARIEELHVHARGLRAWASYLGLGLIALLWVDWARRGGSPGDGSSPSRSTTR